MRFTKCISSANTWPAGRGQRREGGEAKQAGRWYQALLCSVGQAYVYRHMQ